MTPCELALSVHELHECDRGDGDRSDGEADHDPRAFISCLHHRDEKQDVHDSPHSPGCQVERHVVGDQVDREVGEGQHGQHEADQR